jgi:glycosyltransferase involved in cell wall biosynthesis
MIRNDNVINLGEVHDPQNIKISKIFKMADIFSIPGHIGLGINQAMYWNLPVVTEDGGQPPEIHYLIDGKTGYLVKDNDIEELKNKILYLIDNEKIRLEFGNNAHRHILKVASIENMYEAFYNSFHSVL